MGFKANVKMHFRAGCQEGYSNKIDKSVTAQVQTQSQTAAPAVVKIRKYPDQIEQQGTEQI